MNPRSSFYRKVVYGVVIILLLLPLFWLSSPATSATSSSAASPGGKLSQLRDKYNLSQAQLGEIDPTSVTVKLTTLGFRGVAAAVLWNKAADYKMKKDWANYGATLNQITKVLPNFLNVWINQAWNLSYNCSVEFDNYRERYRWVIRGLNFLQEGIEYNKHNIARPRLVYELGWNTSQKIGKADESKQYRHLFANDQDFRNSLPADMRDSCLDDRGQLDNWLVGKKWYQKAVDMVDAEGASMLTKSPLVYRSQGPMCQMNYAEALERDGIFGEKAKIAWITAGNEWHRYGNEELPTSFTREGSEKPVEIRLNDREMHEEAAKRALAKLEALQPGLRAKIVAEKKAALTPAQREALDTPPEKRTPGKQMADAQQAENAIAVSHNEVARRVAGDQRKEALQLAKEAEEHEMLAGYIQRYREVVNFNFWRQRAKSEQTDDLIKARQLVYQGERSYAEGDLVAARNAYQDGLAAWRKALDTHKEYIHDQTTGEDLVDVVKRYRRVLSQLDEPFPKPFILQDILDIHQKAETAPATEPKANEAADKDQHPSAKGGK